MALWRAGRVSYVRALQKYGSGDTKEWLFWWLNQFENEGVLPNV
jgi:hypothetical protein